MKIAVLGANGKTGARIAAEATTRGHDVTGVVRSSPREALAKVDYRIGDATSADQVADLAAMHDIVVHAVRPPLGQEDAYDSMMVNILEGVRGSATRLLVVGGAACLRVPDSGLLVVEDERYVKPEFRPIPEASLRQWRICAASDVESLTYMSPPAEFRPGERTGRYRLGTDYMVTDAEGRGFITMEDYAVAMVDEVESPQSEGRLMTVGY
ncbi:NAD(P)-dependent oxidoreductase [Haloglycomyces albus]|uniref:NAD(P)-dependent oxidoreductase n=1 Tax=Haloglycomyces albus TaxID=526067 RepID=UPI00046D3494|nr:NAD(P)H-binding protein [Haloglycomyces albus]